MTEETIQYGIITVSVANMRRLPVHQAEMVNQIVLGSVVPVYEVQNDFYYVRNRDDYWGWISKHSLKVVGPETARIWQQEAGTMVLQNCGTVRQKAGPDGEVLTDLVPCAVLKKLGEADGYTRVKLPDGRSGFVESAVVVERRDQEAVRAAPEKVVALARQFLGIPYLWGGTSAKAFDCSGFVQTVFRLLNVHLPRDASQMAGEGNPVSLEQNYQHLQSGDLLLFGKTRQRITHVAIYVGDRSFIHAEGRVKINSLDPAHPRYSEHRRETLLLARRVLKGELG